MKSFYSNCSGLGKWLAILVFALGLPLTDRGQLLTPGSLQALAKNNGFKDIRLGADVSKLRSDKLYYLDGDTSRDVDSCLRYEYRDQNARELNGLLLDLVGVRIYHKKVINIYLFFKRDDGYKVLKNFVAIYGDCTDRPGSFMYDWKCNTVNLSLRYQMDMDLGVAIFTYKPLEDQSNKERQSRLALASLQVSTKSL